MTHIRFEPHRAPHKHYAGASFEQSPPASALPPPPSEWLNKLPSGLLRPPLAQHTYESYIPNKSSTVTKDQIDAAVDDIISKGKRNTPPEIIEDIPRVSSKPRKPRKPRFMPRDKIECDRQVKRT